MFVGARDHMKSELRLFGLNNWRSFHMSVEYHCNSNIKLEICVHFSAYLKHGPWRVWVFWFLLTCNTFRMSFFGYIVLCVYVWKPQPLDEWSTRVHVRQMCEIQISARIFVYYDDVSHVFQKWNHKLVKILVVDVVAAGISTIVNRRCFHCKRNSVTTKFQHTLQPKRIRLDKWKIEWSHCKCQQSISNFDELPSCKSTSLSLLSK